MLPWSPWQAWQYIQWFLFLWAQSTVSLPASPRWAVWLRQWQTQTQSAREREREQRGGEKTESGGANELLSESCPASPDVDGHTSKERREGVMNRQWGMRKEGRKGWTAECWPPCQPFPELVSTLRMWVKKRTVMKRQFKVGQTQNIKNTNIKPKSFSFVDPFFPLFIPPPPLPLWACYHAILRQLTHSCSSDFHFPPNSVSMCVHFSTKMLNPFPAKPACWHWKVIETHPHERMPARPRRRRANHHLYSTGQPGLLLRGVFPLYNGSIVAGESVYACQTPSPCPRVPSHSN